MARAEIVLVALARRASAAANPRIRQHALSDLDALGLGADSHHLADVLVPERHRQLHAAVLQAHPLAAAKIEIAVGEVQIAVADAGGENLQQDLGAGRLRRRRLVALERLAADADLEHAHCRFLSRTFLGCRRRALPATQGTITGAVRHGEPRRLPFAAAKMPKN